MCPMLEAPENGAILSTDDAFRYPMMAEFQCRFGYQMMGTPRLQCLADATWNGTVPTCVPAYCGLFKFSDNFQKFLNFRGSPKQFGDRSLCDTGYFDDRARSECHDSVHSTESTCERWKEGVYVVQTMRL